MRWMVESVHVLHVCVGVGPLRRSKGTGLVVLDGVFDGRRQRLHLRGTPLVRLYAPRRCKRHYVNAFV